MITSWLLQVILSLGWEITSPVAEKVIIKLVRRLGSVIRKALVELSSKLWHLLMLTFWVLVSVLVSVCQMVMGWNKPKISRAIWAPDFKKLRALTFVSGSDLVFLVYIKDLRGNPKPRDCPDRTGPKPVRGQGTFLRIFSGRVESGNFISGWSESGNFISSRSGSGDFFYRGMRHLLPGFRG